MRVIIPCVFEKTDYKTKARNLYIGHYFETCMKYAANKTNDKNIFILSAKHGLIALDDLIEPYDMKMGQIGSITDELLKEQAEGFGIIDKDVLAVGEEDYLEKLKKVFKKIKCLRFEEIENDIGR